VTDDPKAPRPRQSLLLPVLIPLVLLVGIGIVLWGFSRLLLRMEPHAATATAFITAAGIVTVVGIVASRKRVNTGSLLTVGIGVIGVAMLASGAALLLASKQPEGAGGPSVILTITAPSGAAASGFQNNSLTAPSDTPFTITFDNQDPGVEHQVTVASADPQKDPSATTYVQGAGITGVSTVDYASPALPAGKYFFFCSFHPTTMTGTLTTSPGASTEGPGGGVSSSITASGLQFNTDSLTFQAGQRRRRRATQPGDLHRLLGQAEPVPRRDRHGGRDGQLHDPGAQAGHLLLPVRHPHRHERHRHRDAGRWRREHGAADQWSAADERATADISATADIGAADRRGYHNRDGLRARLRHTDDHAPGEQAVHADVR
jgi:plastocyanin